MFFLFYLLLWELFTHTYNLYLCSLCLSLFVFPLLFWEGGFSSYLFRRADSSGNIWSRNTLKFYFMLTWGLGAVICHMYIFSSTGSNAILSLWSQRGNFNINVLIFDCFKQISKKYDTSRSEDIEKWAIVHWLKVRGSQTDCCSELVRHRKELASELVFCWFSFFSLFLLDTDMICQELGATVHRLKSIKTSCSNESNWIEEETIFSV